MTNLRHKWRTSVARIIAASGLAVVAAMATSMLVARFAPWSEADRLLAGAVTFPVWWCLWAAAPLLAELYWRWIGLTAAFSGAAIAAAVLL